MAVSTTYPNMVPLALHPGTEAAWRETRGRELIPATGQSEAYARESQVGSDKDKYRTQDGRQSTSSTLASDTTVTLTQEAIQRQSEDASQEQRDHHAAQDQHAEPTAQSEQAHSQEQPARSGDDQTSTATDGDADSPADPGADKQDTAGQPLTSEEQKAVEALSTRDEEVRQHESAHQINGGQYAQAPTFDLTRGPDGKSYATGGEVKIDLSKEATPQATIQKMQQIERAALAPQEPSTQDRRVAARAAQIAEQARADELRQQQQPSAQAQRLSEQAPAAETLIRSINDPKQEEQSPVMTLRNLAISRRYAQSWQSTQPATVSRYA